MRIKPERGSMRPGAAASHAGWPVAGAGAAAKAVGRVILVCTALPGVTMRDAPKPARPTAPKPAIMASLLARLRFSAGAAIVLLLDCMAPVLR